MKMVYSPKCPSCHRNNDPYCLRLIVCYLLITFLTSCNIPKRGTPGPGSGSVATNVALTLTALAQIGQLTTISSPNAPTMIHSTDTPTPTKRPTVTIGSTDTLTPTTLPTPTLKSTITPTLAPGSIAGAITGYPYGSVPSLAIVAFGQEAPYYYSWMITGAGITYFSMSSDFLVPGHFQVVAYDSSGHTGGCPTIVQVKSDQTVTCDITDWGSGYPAKPPSVPAP